ncbi:hypothetical protein D3C77_709640 [compost metagenome]
MGNVKIGITLPYSRFFKVPSHLGEDAFHVSGLQDHLIVFGLEEIGHALGCLPFVEIQFYP